MQKLEDKIEAYSLQSEGEPTISNRLDGQIFEISNDKNWHESFETH